LKLIGSHSPTPSELIRPRKQRRGAGVALLAHFRGWLAALVKETSEEK